MSNANDVVLGVLRIDLSVPHARSLKDRRQVVRSLRDRIRSRFTVSCHELGGDHPQRGGLIVTTGGTDAGGIRGSLDRIRQLVESHPEAWVGQVRSEVVPWHPEGEAWEVDLG